MLSQVGSVAAFALGMSVIPVNPLTAYLSRHQWVWKTGNPESEAAVLAFNKMVQKTSVFAKACNELFQEKPEPMDSKKVIAWNQIPQLLKMAETMYDGSQKILLTLKKARENNRKFLDLAQTVQHKLSAKNFLGKFVKEKSDYASNTAKLYSEFSVIVAKVMAIQKKFVRECLKTVEARML